MKLGSDTMQTVEVVETAIKYKNICVHGCVSNLRLHPHKQFRPLQTNSQVVSELEVREVV